MHCLLNMNKSQNQRFLDIFTAILVHLLALLTDFYKPKWQIFLPFLILLPFSEIPALSYTWSLRRVPSRGEPPHIGQYR